MIGTTEWCSDCRGYHMSGRHFQAWRCVSLEEWNSGEPRDDLDYRTVKASDAEDAAERWTEEECEDGWDDGDAFEVVVLDGETPRTFKCRVSLEMSVNTSEVTP